MAQAGRSNDPVAAFVERRFGTSTYKRADADLNRDGRKEAFIYLTDSNYCGSGGCVLVILSPDRHSYRTVMRSTVTRTPIRVLSSSTHGWRDVGVNVAGGGFARSRLVSMRFNGHRYPSNPTFAPALPLNRPSGKVLLD